MKKPLLTLFLSAFLLCNHFPALSGEIAPSEYKLRAAFIYNFTKFIRWPDTVFSDKKSSFILGILGDSPIEKNLMPLASRYVSGRPIEVKRYQQVREALECHLLYIADADIGMLSTILDTLKKHPVITVGNHKRFVSQGGVIQFGTIQDRLRFIINLEVAKQNGIQIDSRLLSLATEVLGVK